LKRKYGDDSEAWPFREGYERGQRYHVLVIEQHKAVDKNSARRAA
jgi:hypothetical protein